MKLVLKDVEYKNKCFKLILETPGDRIYGVTFGSDIHFNTIIEFLVNEHNLSYNVASIIAREHISRKKGPEALPG